MCIAERFTCSIAWMYINASPSVRVTHVMSTAHFLALPTYVRWNAFLFARPFSVYNRPQPKYEGHVPLNTVERGALAAGSAIMSLINPQRAGLSSLSVVPKTTL